MVSVASLDLRSKPSQSEKGGFQAIAKVFDELTKYN
jgi:hypothetical protein